jgi:hypothetical protein
MLSSKKYTLWGLKCNRESKTGSKVQSKATRAQKRNLFDQKSIRNFKLNSKKYTLWDLKCKPQIMRAQKSGQILIFEINKDY